MQFRLFRDVVFVGRHSLEPAGKKFLPGLNAGYCFLRHILGPEALTRSERISRALGAALAASSGAASDPLANYMKNMKIEYYGDRVNMMQLRNKAGPRSALVLTKLRDARAVLDEPWCFSVDVVHVLA